MTIGLIKIGLRRPLYVLRLEDLAAIVIPIEKLSKGSSLKRTSVAPITEDIVTLADTADDINR